MKNIYSLGKFLCPALPPKILHRENLVARLNTAMGNIKDVSHPYKLVLLNAPAGYGKTTLLTDFAYQKTLSCCWYHLDGTDVDKVVFLGNLLTSIRQQFPYFKQELDTLLSGIVSAESRYLSNDHAFEVVIDALVKTIADEISERFAIILCNYHEVDASQAINDLLNQLLQKMPPQCVLVLESRSIPKLEFVPLLARREMIGIGSDALKFTLQDINELARIQGVSTFGEDEARQLVSVFDGWIAGILLGTRLSDVDFVHVSTEEAGFSAMTKVPVDRQKLFAYIVNEIFKRNPDMYIFLKRASILQQMIPAFCVALFEDSTAAKRLQFLEQQGLFVSHTDDGFQMIYTCHQVLRNVLYDELRQSEPDTFRALHQRAAQLFLNDHHYDQAFMHAQEAQVDSIIVDIIIKAHEQLFTQGNTEKLARWIDVLPSSALSRYPKLLLIRANILLLIGDHHHAQSLLDQASAALASQPASIECDDSSALQVEVAVTRCKVMFQQGEYSQAQALCQQLLQHILVDEVSLRAEVYMRLGICTNLLGDLDAGIDHLQQALQLLRHKKSEAILADIHDALASSYSLQGNFALAEHHLARAIKYWNILHNEWGKVNNLSRMGLIKQRQGAFAEAEKIFLEALTIAQGGIRFQRGEAYLLVNLGELYQDQGKYDHALIMTEDGLDLARQLQDRYLINCATCTLAMTYLLMGDVRTAMLLLSDVDIQHAQQSISGYERVVHELTYGTVLFYQHRYQEAYACFASLEKSVDTMGLKREALQTKIRIASCLLLLQQPAQTVEYLKDVAQILLRGDYDYLVSMELQRQSALEQFVQTQPEIAHLGRLLRREDEAPEKLSASEFSLPSSPHLAAVDIASSAIEDTQAPSSVLKIYALGEPLVALDDLPITRWRMARAMELFFFLLNSNHPLRKESIMDELWSEVDDRTNQTFHSTVYYLRKALGDSCVTSQNGTYSLNLNTLYGTNVWYDVQIFQDLYHKGKEALAQGHDVVAREAFLSMVDLYRGDYVQSFYNNWCRFPRDKWCLAYMDARSQLAHIAWRNEKFEECTMHWQYILALDSCQEEAHYGLMRCYLRQGKRGLAQRQYRRCADTLQSELSIQPGSAIQALYQRLISSNPRQAATG